MLALAFLVSLFLSPPVEASVLTVPMYDVKEEWSREMVRELAIDKAKEYGLHTKRFLATIECESNFESVQSDHYYNGEREESYGVAQFWIVKPMTLEDGTPITREIAEDPAQAIPAMAWHFSQGRAYKWTCWRALR